MVPIEQIRAGVEYLTEMEMRAFKLSSEAVTIAQASRDLGISEASVSDARQRIAHKLHIRAYQVTACAVRWFTWLECNECPKQSRSTSSQSSAKRRESSSS